MRKLNDGVHNCKECNLYPCTTQPFISKPEDCEKCQAHHCCCHAPMVALLPCEIKSGKIKQQFEGLILFKMENGFNGYCYAFNEETKNCEIYNIRPIACRIATCRMIDPMAVV